MKIQELSEKVQNLENQKLEKSEEKPEPSKVIIKEIHKECSEEKSDKNL